MRELALLSDAELSAVVIRCAAEVDRAQAQQAAVVGEWQARRAWAAHGAMSPTACLVEHTPTTRPGAARLCRTARLVHEHPLTACALEAGHVSTAHVDVLAAAVRGREKLYADHEETLLNAASGLIPDDLVTVAKRWRALADDKLAAGAGNPDPDGRTCRMAAWPSKSAFPPCCVPTPTARPRSRPTGRPWARCSAR